MGLIKTKTPAH